MIIWRWIVDFLYLPREIGTFAPSRTWLICPSCPPTWQILELHNRIDSLNNPIKGRIALDWKHVITWLKWITFGLRIKELRTTTKPTIKALRTENFFNNPEELQKNCNKTERISKGSFRRNNSSERIIFKCSHFPTET